MLKNRLLRKKSSEENSIPDLVDRIKPMTRSQPEEGIVCRTHELKRLLRESSDGPERTSRSSNRSSFDENDGAAAEVETTETKDSSDSEKDEDEESGRASASKVKWDEVSLSLPYFDPSIICRCLTSFSSCGSE